MSAQPKSTFYENDPIERRFARKCVMCKKVSANIRRLPCNDHFCKKCLKSFLKLPNMNSRESFKCPRCHKDIKSPDRPLTDFKVVKSSVFYSDWSTSTCLDFDGPELSEIVNTTNCSHSPEKSDAVPRRSDIQSLRNMTSSVQGKNSATNNTPQTPSANPRQSKGQYCRRSGMLLEQDYKYSNAFYSNISTDTKTCQYWGGDVLPSDGFVALADWMNGTVKVFSANGDCKTSFKDLRLSPYCVSYLRDDIMVVSYGSKYSAAVLLKLTRQPGFGLKPFASKDLEGFLYATTRCGTKCYGIFEHRNHRIGIAEVSVNAAPLSLSAPTHDVIIQFPDVDDRISPTSSSSLHYCHMANRLYVTEGIHLYSLNTEFKLLHQESYLQKDGEYYNLGSVTTTDGIVVVASDLCVLRLDKDLDVLTVIPTKYDPFFIVQTSRSCEIFVLSRSDEVDAITLVNWKKDSNVVTQELAF